MHLPLCVRMANIQQKCVHIITYGQKEHFFFYILGYYPAQLCCCKTFKYTFGLEIGLVDVVEFLRIEEIMLGEKIRNVCDHKLPYHHYSYVRYGWDS